MHNMGKLGGMFYEQIEGGQDSMWARTIEQSKRYIISHDRSQIRFFPGLRNSIGVVVAMVVGIISGNILMGLSMAIGGQVAGFAGLNGTLRRRLRTMLFAAIWMGVTSWIGGITAGGWLSVVLMALSGFAAGIFICVSNEAGLIGMWATIALIFITGFHLPASGAAGNALFVFLGGLLQTVLMLGTDWLRGINAETAGVISAYKAISDYAEQDSREADLQVAAALSEAYHRLRDSMLPRGHWDRLRTMLDLAESVRIELVALSVAIRTLSDEPVQSVQEHLSELKQARCGIGEAISFIADNMRRTSPLAKGPILSPSGGISNPIQRVQTRVTQFSQGVVLESFRTAYGCLDRATTELVKAWRWSTQQISHSALETGLSDSDMSSSRRFASPWSQLRSSYESIRVNLTFGSSAFRHAIRLGTALGVATIVSYLSPIPRGYWMPLTTLVILKPEFSITMSRGSARVIGTLLGALFATFLVAIPDPTHILGVTLVGVFLWGMYTFLNYNMVLFSCLLTAEVVVLISFFQNVGPLSTLTDRVTYTIAGSVLAFLAYLAWPTWQHRNVPSAIKNLIQAERGYLQSVLRQVQGAKEERVEDFRKRTRLARTNAANIVEQFFNEPVHGGLDPQSVQGILTALHRLSDGLLSLEAHLAEKLIWQPVKQDIVLFGAYLDRGLAEIEDEIGEENLSDSQRSDRNIRSKARSGTGEPPLYTGRNKAGALDEVSPLTKQQIGDMQVPLSLKVLFVRMEDNLATMFRMLPLTGDKYGGNP